MRSTCACRDRTRAACRHLALASPDVRACARRRVPAPVRRLRFRAVAFLLGLPPAGGAARAAVVRSVRITGIGSGGVVRGLPAAAARPRPSAFPFRGSGAFGGPPAEVLRVARCRGRARRGDGGGDARSGRRGDLGSTVQAAAGRAWVRPGEGPRGGRRARARPPRSPDAPADRRRRRHPSPSRRRGSARRDVGTIRTDPFGARAGSGAARRRRPHDGCDRLRVCGRAAGGRRRRGLVARRGARGPAEVASGLYSARARAWVCGCPGNVSSVVDASRGRSDPRKATFGR